MSQLFIAWVPFQRRSASMQVYFEYELYFLSLSFKGRWLRPLEYALKSIKTLWFFIIRRPQIIWIQLPPTPLLYLALFYRMLAFQEVLIVADCHNATFRPPWIKLPKVVSFLNQCDIILVHSVQVKSQAREFGISDEVVHLLEDPTNSITEVDSSALTSKLSHPWVLCPCSFNRDEPINEILNAARLAPEITFVLTGRFDRARGIHDLTNIPDNVKLTGFLPVSKFNALLLETDVVLGFTQLDGIQLSAAVEATAAGVPMLLSDTKLLRQLFYKGAVYVDSANSSAIAQKCKQVLSDRDILASQVRELRDERSADWLLKAETVSVLLNQ